MTTHPASGEANWTRADVDLLASAWAEDGIPDTPTVAAVSFIEDTGCGTLIQFTIAGKSQVFTGVRLDPLLLHFNPNNLANPKGYSIFPLAWAQVL